MSTLIGNFVKLNAPAATLTGSCIPSDLTDVVTELRYVPLENLWNWTSKAIRVRITQRLDDRKTPHVQRPLQHLYEKKSEISGSERKDDERRKNRERVRQKTWDTSS